MEDNKLIAEFMGVFHQGIFPPVTIGEQMYTLDELHYHTSWDWLMPVVQKVSSLCDEPYELDNMKHALLTGDIESVYDDVVEFIKTYNDER